MNKINVIIPLPYIEIDDVVLTCAMIEAVATNDFRKYYDVVGTYTITDDIAEVSEVVKLINVLNRLENVLMPMIKTHMVTKICNLIIGGYTIYDIGNYYGNTKITFEHNGNL